MMAAAQSSMHTGINMDACVAGHCQSAASGSDDMMHQPSHHSSLSLAHVISLVGWQKHV